MAAIGHHQITFAGLGLASDSPLKTEPPTYLWSPGAPDTKPTFLFLDLLLAPSPSRKRSNGHGAPGEQATLADLRELLTPPPSNGVTPRGGADNPSPTPGSAAEERLRQSLPDVVPWIPSNSFAMPGKCDGCGATVSKKFKTVHSDNHGFLEHCRECAPRSVRFGGEDIYGRDDEQIGEHYQPPRSSR